MRIAVTGATGFVGGHVARRLADAGHEVLGTGRRDVAAVPGVSQYVRWDLGDPDARPPAAFAGVDAVVHTASHVADWGPEETFDCSRPTEAI